MSGEPKKPHVFSARLKIDAVRAARWRLFWGVLLFAAALAVPVTLLLRHSVKRIKAEALYEQRLAARDVADRTMRRLDELLRPEELRLFEEYECDAAEAPAQPTETAEAALRVNQWAAGAMPGFIGYFQIDPDGAISCPPEAIRQALAAVNLVTNAAIHSASPALVHTLDGQSFSSSRFAASFLSGGRIAFYRAVWRPGGTEEAAVTRQDWEQLPLRRYLQGFVVEQRPFFEMLLETAFSYGALHAGVQAQLVRRGKIFLRHAPQGDAGDNPIVLLQSPLAPIFPEVELLLTATETGTGAAWRSAAETVAVLVFVMAVGLLVIYRLAVAHLDVAQQRSDFVSAITHELKSPLTSIRMYAEMLSAGWVNDEEKRKRYYDYILSEGERLSRLIENVLDLAKLARRRGEVELKEYPVEEVVQKLSKVISSQIETAGFTLTIHSPPEEAILDSTVLLDLDSTTRVIVNLVDNALKFAKDSSRKEVQLGWRIEGEKDGGETLCFFVRDFGPGVAPEQRDRIFELFYRGEDELTRATPGTGIGLALVRELCEKMGAEAGVRDPGEGAEFQILFTRLRQL